MTMPWWSSSSGRIELKLTYDQAEMVPRSGAADDAVEVLSEDPDVAEQLEKIDPADLRSELEEYGAWNDEELSDHDQNLKRLLWLAALDIQEDDTPDDDDEDGDDDDADEDGAEDDDE